jgi:hypothetical protein
MPLYVLKRRLTNKVVITATALDFAIRSTDGEAVAGLLVALRFWRIIRVVDSVAISTKYVLDLWG